MKPLKPPRPGLPRLPRERRVLAIVGDTQVGLWTVRSLARGGLAVLAVCGSANGLAAHSRFCAGAWKLEARPTDPAWGEEVLALARELDAGSVMTIAESYHRALIRCRDRFEPAIHVFSPSAENFAKATDKDFMHSLAQKLGIAVARGTTLDRLMAAPGENALRFPLVLTRATRMPGRAPPPGRPPTPRRPGSSRACTRRSGPSPPTCSSRSTTPAWRPTSRCSCTAARRSWPASTSASTTCRWPAA